MTTVSRRTPGQGSILILTLLVSAAMVFFCLAFYSLYNGSRLTQLRSEARIVAEAAASGGIEDAIYQLKKDATWKAGFSAVRLAHSGATYTVTFTQGVPGIPWSTNNVASSSPVKGYGDRVVPATSAHVVCIGQYAGVTVTEEVILTRSAASPFQYGVIGANGMRVGSLVTTDGYDSSVGPYSSTRDSTKGGIATNATAAGTVLLDLWSRIGGDVLVGPGGGNSVITGSGTYQSVQALSTPMSLTPPTAPTDTAAGSVSATSTRPGRWGLGRKTGHWSSSGGWLYGWGPSAWWLQGSGAQSDLYVFGNVTLQPGSYGNLTLTGWGTVTLNSGTYVFSSINNLGGCANIVLGSGPVNLYFTGDSDFGYFSRLNAGGSPSNLTLFATSTVRRVNIGDYSQGSFGLYAPTAHVNLGWYSNLYGSVVGSSVDVYPGTTMHYDQALSNTSGSDGGGPWSVLARW